MNLVRRLNVHHEAQECWDINLSLEFLERLAAPLLKLVLGFLLLLPSGLIVSSLLLVLVVPAVVVVYVVAGTLLGLLGRVGEDGVPEPGRSHHGGRGGRA